MHTTEIVVEGLPGGTKRFLYRELNLNYVRVPDEVLMDAVALYLDINPDDFKREYQRAGTSFVIERKPQ